MSVNVSVIPIVGAYCENALFEGRRLDQGEHQHNVHWMDYWSAIASEGARQGIEFQTCDRLAPLEADAVIYMKPPATPGEVLALKAARPDVTVVYLPVETSLGAAYLLNQGNIRGMDFVFSHDSGRADGKRFFHLRTRAPNRSRIRDGLPFGERRVACLIGANRKMRYRSGLGTIARGWAFNRAEWLDCAFCPGQLITYRTRAGIACARRHGKGFDLYGIGWEDVPETGKACLGVPSCSTLELLGSYRFTFAFENQAGKGTLISERIWDALWADCVPVYRGNEGISEYVPSDCFVDACQFDSFETMMDWMARVPERDWEKIRKAGRDFIHSQRVERFLPEAFARDFVDFLGRLVRRSDSI